MNNTTRRSVNLRAIRASLRDTWLLLREFAWPLTGFLFAIAGGGLLYFYLSQVAGEPTSNPVEAIYQMLALTFLQPMGEFPQAWYLELFYFVMPLIGLMILSHGVADFGTMFFNRKQRSKEWEMAVASTFRRHHILVGLGHLGFRIVRNLHDLAQDVVVIELNPKDDLVAIVKKLGIPVIQGDAMRQSSLESAGIQHAQTIILCTQNDSMNLHVALKARRLNKNIRVVARIFDNDFAQTLQEQFGFTVFSATQMAAPVFAAAAAGVDMTQPLTIAGQQLSLAKLSISPDSKLTGYRLAQVEDQFNVSVVFLSHQNIDDLHPNGERRLEDGDIIAILGGPAEITRLVQENL